MHYFSPLNTFMRKGKDPDPDPYIWLMDPDPRGPKTCGSGSPTLVQRTVNPLHCARQFITVSFWLSRKGTSLRWTALWKRRLACWWAIWISTLLTTKSSSGFSRRTASASGPLSAPPGGCRLFMIVAERHRLLISWVLICEIQCCGSMTFWDGSGSADPCLWLMDPDPDPAIFVIDLQDASKKLIFCHAIFSADYFLRVHLHHFSKIKSQKESQISRNQGFSYYLFLHGDRRIRIRIHTSD